MKAAVDLTETRLAIYQLHFNRPVPALPKSQDRPFARRRLPGIDRYIQVDSAAEIMHQINNGRSPIELPDPLLAYQSLLNDLAFGIPGLVEIASLDTYCWVMRVGRLFDPEVVGRKVILRLRQHCFPSDKLNIVVLNPSHDSDDDFANQPENSLEDQEPT